MGTNAILGRREIPYSNSIKEGCVSSINPA